MNGSKVGSHSSRANRPNAGPRPPVRRKKSSRSPRTRSGRMISNASQFEGKQSGKPVFQSMPAELRTASLPANPHGNTLRQVSTQSAHGPENLANIMAATALPLPAPRPDRQTAPDNSLLASAQPLGLSTGSHHH